MALVLMLLTCRGARALRSTLSHTSTRRASTRVSGRGRQRVGASEEELREREESFGAQPWEYGEEPYEDEGLGGSLAVVGGDADDAEVAKGVDALAPYVSASRRRKFAGVAASRTRRLRVAFERPSNPSNVWACLRTIDAFGVQSVDVVRDTAETAAERAAARGVAGMTSGHRRRPRRMSAAMGAQKWVSLAEREDAAALVADLKARGFVVAATDLGPGSVPLSAVDWAAEPHALVFGNEEVGISEELRALADVRVHLPMKGLAESLNLSVSVGACLAHVAAVGALEPDLDPAAQNRLLLAWYAHSVKASDQILRRAGVQLGEADRVQHAVVLGCSTA